MIRSSLCTGIIAQISFNRLKPCPFSQAPATPRKELVVFTKSPSNRPRGGPRFQERSPAPFFAPFMRRNRMPFWLAGMLAMGKCISPIFDENRTSRSPSIASGTTIDVSPEGRLVRVRSGIPSGPASVLSNSSTALALISPSMVTVRARP